MSWLRIEGRMPHHRKVAPLSDAAFRLHVTASAWCVEEETDGKVPPKVPGTLPAAPRGKALTKVLDELVGAGLWEKVGDDYEIHDFLVYNPTAAESLAARAAVSVARAAAGAVGGKRSAELRAIARQAREEAKAEANELAIAQANAKQIQAPIPTPIPFQPDTTIQRPDRSDDPNRMGPKAVVAGDSKLPIAERARKVLENPYDGTSLQPSKWPEVQAIGAAWSFGMALDLRDNPKGDSDLRSILEALAAGTPPERLVAIGATAAGNEYFKKMRRPGPAAFTAAVIRRLLADLDSVGSSPNQDDTGGYGNRSEWAV